MQSLLVHASMAASLSNVSLFLTSSLAIWLRETESWSIRGIGIVLFNTSVYFSPIMVGLLGGGWTECGLASAFSCVGFCPARLLLVGCGPTGGLGGVGGFGCSLNFVADGADFVCFLVVILVVRNCTGGPILLYACRLKSGFVLGCCS